MLQFLHQFDFLNTIISLLDVIDIKNLEQFERDYLVCLYVLCFEHKGKFALSYWLEYFVVSVNSTVKVAIPYGRFAAIFDNGQIIWVIIISLSILLVFAAFEVVIIG